MAKPTYSFRIRTELRDQLAEEARSERRSATNMLELILEERYDASRSITMLGFEMRPDEISTIGDLRKLGEEILQHVGAIEI